MPSAVVRILLVDDHSVFTDAVASALADEPDLEIAAVAGAGAAALEAYGGDVDVVLCDFRLPDLDGIEVARRILADDANAKVVMLTASTDEAVLVAAIEVGCAGFVSKTAALSEVVGAVRAAAVGESVISPMMLARLLPRLGRGEASGVDDLTPRELEVLEEMARGGTNREVGEALFIAPDTVRNHVASLSQKLGAHSKLEAVAVAVRRGIISLGGDV